MAKKQELPLKDALRPSGTVTEALVPFQTLGWSPPGLATGEALLRIRPNSLNNIANELEGWDHDAVFLQPWHWLF